MSATTFLALTLAGGLAGLAAAGASTARANDTTTSPAGDGRSGRPSTPLARRLAEDAARARAGTLRPARAVVLGIYVPAVNRARLMPTRRLARHERRLRRAHARGAQGPAELIALAAARMVLAERGRALPALAGRPLPRLTERADQ